MAKLFARADLPVRSESGDVVVTSARTYEWTPEHDVAPKEDRVEGFAAAYQAAPCPECGHEVRRYGYSDENLASGGWSVRCSECSKTFEGDGGHPGFDF